MTPATLRHNYTARDLPHVGRPTFITDLGDSSVSGEKRNDDQYKIESRGSGEKPDARINRCVRIVIGYLRWFFRCNTAAASAADTAAVSVADTAAAPRPGIGKHACSVDLNWQCLLSWLLILLMPLMLSPTALAQTREADPGMQVQGESDPQGKARNTEATVKNPYYNSKQFLYNQDTASKRNQVYVSGNGARGVNGEFGAVDKIITGELTNVVFQAAEQGQGNDVQRIARNSLNASLGSVNDTYRGLHQWFKDDLVGNLFTNVGQLMGKWLSELINGWIADAVQYLAQFLRIFVLNPNVAVNGLNGQNNDGISPYIRQGADIMYGIAVDLLLLLFILCIWKYWAEASWKGAGNLMGPVGRLIATAGLLLAWPTIYAFEVQITNEMIKAIYFNSAEELAMLHYALGTAVKGGLIAAGAGALTVFAPILSGGLFGSAAPLMGSLFYFASLVVFTILGGVLITELVYLLVLKAVQTALLVAQYMFAPIFLVFFATPDTENIATGYIKAFIETSLWTFVWVGLLRIMVIIIYSNFNPWGKILISIGVLQLMIQVPTFLARAQISPASDFISAGLVTGGLSKALTSLSSTLAGGVNTMVGKYAEGKALQGILGSTSSPQPGLGAQAANPELLNGLNKVSEAERNRQNQLPGTNVAGAPTTGTTPPSRIGSPLSMLGAQLQSLAGLGINGGNNGTPHTSSGADDSIPSVLSRLESAAAGEPLPKPPAKVSGRPEELLKRLQAQVESSTGRTAPGAAPAHLEQSRDRNDPLNGQPLDGASTSPVLSTSGAPSTGKSDAKSSTSDAIVNAGGSGGLTASRPGNHASAPSAGTRSDRSPVSSPATTPGSSGGNFAGSGASTGAGAGGAAVGVGVGVGGSSGTGGGGGGGRFRFGAGEGVEGQNAYQWQNSAAEGWDEKNLIHVPVRKLIGKLTSVDGVGLRMGERETGILGTADHGVQRVSIAAGANNAEVTRALYTSAFADQVSSDDSARDAARRSAFAAGAHNPQGFKQSLIANWMDANGKSWYSSPWAKENFSRAMFSSAVDGSAAYLKGDSGNAYTDYLRGRYGNWDADGKGTQDALAMHFISNPESTESPWNRNIGPATEGLIQSGIPISMATRGAMQNMTIQGMHPARRKQAVFAALSYLQPQAKEMYGDQPEPVFSLALGEMARALPAEQVNAALTMFQVSGQSDLKPDYAARINQLSSDTGRELPVAYSSLATAAPHVARQLGRVRGGTNLSTIRTISDLDAVIQPAHNETHQQAFQVVMDTTASALKTGEMHGVPMRTVLNPDIAPALYEFIGGDVVNMHSPSAHRKMQILSRNLNTVGTPNDTRTLNAINTYVQSGGSLGTMDADHINVATSLVESGFSGRTLPAAVEVALRGGYYSGNGGSLPIDEIRSAAQHYATGQVSDYRYVPVVTQLAQNRMPVNNQTLRIAAQSMADNSGTFDAEHVNAVITVARGLRNANLAPNVVETFVRAEGAHQGVIGATDIPLSQLIGELRTRGTGLSAVASNIGVIQRDGGFSDHQMQDAHTVQVVVDNGGTTAGPRVLQAVNVLSRMVGAERVSEDPRYLQVTHEYLENNGRVKDLDVRPIHCLLDLDARRSAVESQIQSLPPGDGLRMDLEDKLGRFHLNYNTMRSVANDPSYVTGKGIDPSLWSRVFR